MKEGKALSNGDEASTKNEDHRPTRTTTPCRFSIQVLHASAITEYISAVDGLAQEPQSRQYALHFFVRPAFFEHLVDGWHGTFAQVARVSAAYRRSGLRGHVRQGRGGQRRGPDRAAALARR
jgi:hypothetical protein